MAVFNLHSFCKDNICPGANHNINGPRGSGKTHLAIAISENVVKHRLPCATENVVVMTNVVMEKRTSTNEDGFIQAYPPGVQSFNTFIDLLKEIGMILRKYGMGKVTIIVILDEAQNYMLSDQNGRPENLAISKFMGNARKFGVCTFFITPTRKNLVPRIRGFEDSDEAGYCRVEWRKDRHYATEYVDKYGLDVNPRDIVTIRMSDDDDPIPIWIPPSTWTKDPEKSNVGDYVYQTLAAADFSLGENPNGVKFEIDDFLKFVSGKSFRRMPDLIEDYFIDFDARCPPKGKGEKEAAPEHPFLKHSVQCEAIDAMRSDDVPWKTIASWFGEDEGTLRARHKKFFELYPERKREKVKSEKASPGRVYIKPNLKEKGEIAPSFHGDIHDVKEEGVCSE